ncbi:MAG: hypothetical protein ACPG77_18455, partial [Nannocystaceae bacterium]
MRKAAHLLREAKAARFDKAYDHAVRLLLRAAELAPLDSSIRVELAKTYQASGNLIEAAREARRAQEDGPDDPQRTYLLAYLLVEVGQFQEAEHLLLELKQVYPNNPNLLGELGLIWRNTRQLKLLLHKILPLAAATDDAKLLGLCAQGL